VAKKTKDNERGQDKYFSNFMVDHKGDLVDLFKYRVIHSGLDTVRQLYAGLVIPSMYSEIEKSYEDGFGLTVEILGFKFIVSSGGKSGYRYILKNNNIGLVIMFGSQFTEPNYSGDHLKIQTSPIYTLSRDIEQVQKHLDDFAEALLTQVIHTGVAVHLCADVQGWVPPSDLDSRLTTKARRIVRHSGPSQINYEFSDVSVVYGKAESFTFGSAGSLQFNLYDKRKANKNKNEGDIWEPVWLMHPKYDIEAPVFRFEFRFHHNIVNQFANGSGFQADKLTDIKEHLNGLWRYSMDNFRLDDTKTYINPFWQWLRDDLKFYDMPKLEIDYKREYKSPLEQGRPSNRAISICFGQLCSIYGRNGYSMNKASNHLQKSGIWENLVEMYIDRGGSSDDVFIDLELKLSRFVEAA